jgi:tetratricopeptide (TPR) repeat protein
MIVLCMSALSLSTATARPAAEVDRGAARAEFLQLLHDGRFDEAEERLAEPGSLHAGAERDFLRAFVCYWRLLYDESDPAQKSAFEARLEATLTSTEARLSVAPRDAEALLWSGTAHLFLAELRARDKRPFAAAKEARRGRRALEAALAADPGLADAAFGLGTVNVLADELPSAARGLTAILGLSGDRERGYGELERAAREGKIFSLESRISLMLSFRSSRRNKAYQRCLDEAERASLAAPLSVAALGAASGVRLALGSATRAAADLDTALAMVRSAPRTDRGVVASLIVTRSRAELALFRPDLALDWLRRLIALGPGLAPAVRKDGAEAARSARSVVPAPPWFAELARVLGMDPASPSDPATPAQAASWGKATSILDLERIGETERLADRLGALASEEPGDAILPLLAGRAQLIAGRPAKARAWLARAEASPGLPREWLGPCLLLEGTAADLVGERAAAVEFYRRATEAPAFVEKEAAWFRLAVPYRGAS